MNRILKRIMVLFSLLLMLFLTACSPVVVPPQSTYSLSAWQPAVQYRRAKTPLTLLVSTPVASPGYQSDGMVYVEVPYQLRTYANNRWIAPPSQMLLPLIAERIRNAGYFYAVVTPPFAGTTNLRLDTQLLVLRQEFFSPVSQVRLLVQASLVSNKTNRVIASRRFQAVVKSPGNNPYSGVLAANKAAAKVATQIARFVRARA